MQLVLGAKRPIRKYTLQCTEILMQMDGKTLCCQLVVMVPARKSVKMTGWNIFLEILLNA